jgi:hypothetical protein
MSENQSAFIYIMFFTQYPQKQFVVILHDSSPCYHSKKATKNGLTLYFFLIRNHDIVQSLEKDSLEAIYFYNIMNFCGSFIHELCDILNFLAL